MLNNVMCKPEVLKTQELFTKANVLYCNFKKSKPDSQQNLLRYFSGRYPLLHQVSWSSAGCFLCNLADKQMSLETYLHISSFLRKGIKT